VPTPAEEGEAEAVEAASDGVPSAGGSSAE